MNSQDQQHNAQNRLLKLPIELHYELSSYISTFCIKHLSQTSLALRNVYHPILYRNCKVSDRHQCEIVPKTYWMIRSWVLFDPSNYSWFPNQAVQNIVVNDSFSIAELKYYVKPSDYPNLVSFKVVPETYRSQLAITLQNPRSYSRRDLKIPHLSTNDFLPAVKSDERIHAIRCPTNPGTYYVLQCNNTEIRSMITSLNLNFQEKIDERWLGEVLDIAKELKAYANLKDLKIWCSDRFDYGTFKTLIGSVTKLKSLDSLMIDYQSTSESTIHLKVLDNLQGSWNTFNLRFVFRRSPFTSDIFLRLPTVTNLMLVSYCSRYRYFGGNLVFGSDIKQLTFPFHSAGEFLSEYHRAQNVLDNLTTLKVVFPPSSHIIYYQEDIEMVVFTKVLPNLKTFEIRMQYFRILPKSQLDGFPELSKTLFSLVPFGEFDILNYESIKPYVQELKRNALKKWKWCHGKVQLINSCVALLENANEDSNIYELYYNFFLLQFLYPAFSCEQRGDIYCKHRTIISLLLLRLLQYTPNLETLTLLGVPLQEEFVAFHRLIKYHRHLKTVSTRMIFIGDIRSFCHESHDGYSRYRRFAKPVRHQIHDNQVFVTEPTEPTRPNGISCDLEGFEYDVEGFRNDHTSKLSSVPDRDLERYELEEGGECIFTESLPLNINEVKDYTIRQDLLIQRYKIGGYGL